MHTRLTLTAFLLSLSFAALPTFADTPVATVNGVAIAQSALATALAQAQSRGAADTPQLRQALKSQLIARELLRQEAARQLSSDDAEVQAAVSQARDIAMVQKYLRTAVKPKPVTEADIRAQYEKIVSALGPQEYKARLIQTADQAAAKVVLTELKAGKPFDQLARQYSKAPSAQEGGALEWVSFKLPLVEGATQGYPLPIAEKLTQLKAGMVSADAIAWQGSWYVLKLDQVRATQIPEFDKVKPTLTKMLTQIEVERASAELVAGLVKAAKIQ